jgi:hypothetical protein
MPDISLENIEVIQAHKSKEARMYMDRFFNKFFNDKKKRFFVIGINAGRFGAGNTGIPFTDSVQLEVSCGIPNTLKKRSEISSEFLYKFINEWRGTQEFYQNFFFTGMSPVGFLKNGTNCNYYDDPDLLSNTKPFIIETLTQQFTFGARREAVIIIGSGKNAKIFNELNKEHQWFKEVFIVEHPRFIMQYRRKHINEYLIKYTNVFSEVLSKIQD